MLSKQIVSEDTREVMLDEFAEAYANSEHPDFAVAVIIHDLIAALEAAEYEADERALEWTDEQPTAHGVYWVEAVGNGDGDCGNGYTYRSVVDVLSVNDRLMAFYPGNECDKELSDFTRWAGPIPMPKL